MIMLCFIASYMSVTYKPLSKCAILPFVDASNLNVLETFLQQPQSILYGHDFDCPKTFVP